MKNIFLHTFLIAYSLIAFTCQKNPKTIDFDTDFVISAEVITPQALQVNVDNFARLVSVTFPSGTNISDVRIRLTLAPGVSMEEPKEKLWQYDLTKKTTFKVRKDRQIVLFRIKPEFETIPLNLSSKGWENKTNFGQLPLYLSVYKYDRKMNDKNVVAYISIADMNDKLAKFTVLGEAQGLKTPNQFYDSSGKPKIVLNAGYFWDGHSLGLIVRDGKTIKPAQPMVWRNYNNVSTVYYPTQGAFIATANGTFQAHWAYEYNGKLYVYPSPSPNKAGEKPQEIPSDKFPAGSQELVPKEAIGAGPLLIKNGEYKNLWEYEMFDAFSGVGPTTNNPRSAIGYIPSGYLVFFVCEGRNKTPNTPGLTLKEVADLLMDLGCTEAINLDGGGSSCMLINGQETIIPSDGKQRAITSMVAMY